MFWIDVISSSMWYRSFIVEGPCASIIQIWSREYVRGPGLEQTRDRSEKWICWQVVNSIVPPRVVVQPVPEIINMIYKFIILFL